MNFKRISVYSCEIGMKLAEDIYNKYGAVVVPMDTILDEQFIEKIKNLDITRVKIYDGVLKEDPHAEAKVKYAHNADVIKDVLHNLSVGKDVNMSAVNQVTQALGTTFENPTSVIKCLNDVRGFDQYTYSHSVNVSLLSMLLARWAKLGPGKVSEIAKAGLLHDIGKAKIDPSIINKPGKLTEAEFNEIKMHPVIAYRELQKTDVSKNISTGVLMHHEKEDGTGYPMNAKGSQIPEYAKIITIVDIYDAMTSDRVYQKKDSPFKVLARIQSENFGKLDVKLLNLFIYNLVNYYIGEYVELNTGETGEIVYVDPANPLYPLIRVDNVILDLSKENDVSMVRLI
ncbi:MAG TPA: HD domain-containing phosphohydrolase [Clostridia bacterium]